MTNVFVDTFFICQINDTILKKKNVITMKLAINAIKGFANKWLQL